MKRILLTGALVLLTALGLGAQSFRLVFPDDSIIPKAARPIVEQRLQQMLEAGGFTVSEAEGTPELEVSAIVTSRMETPGSMSQVALTIDLAVKAGGISEIFPLKGVGADEADAWTRAAKMLLPRSKAAQAFVEKLK